MWFAEETNYGSSNGQANMLRLVHVADPLTATPSDFVDFTGNVPLYQFTFVPDPSTGGNHPWNNGDTNNNALQAGSSAFPNPGLIDTNDTRIDSAVWATVNGQQHLVLTQTVEDPADPTTAKARWYDFNTTGVTDPSVAVPLYQSGEINPGAGVFTYFPSAAIDPAGDIGMTYLQSSASQLFTMYVTGKTLSESGMETGVPIINDSPLAGPDGSPHRAGDYSGTVVDISSTGTRMNSFWSANQYASGGNWATALENFSISSTVQPPTITSISANPSPVTGKTTTLSVTASDPNPAGSITAYSWSLLSGPAGVTFGSSTASSTGVTFTKAGTYQFQVTVTDSYGLTSTSTVTVTVQQTLTSISLSPSSVTLMNGQTQTFTATAFDQFGNAMTTQPTFAWTWSGIGTFKKTSNTTLQYRASSTGTGTATITVSVSGTSFASTATITVTKKRH
jgi:hypothetical protein